MLLGLTQLSKHMNQRVVNYVQKLDQAGVNRLIAYLKENDFELLWDQAC